MLRTLASFHSESDAYRLLVLLYTTRVFLVFVHMHASVYLFSSIIGRCLLCLFQIIFFLSTSVHPFQSYYTWASHVTLPYCSLCIVNIQQISCARSFYYNSSSSTAKRQRVKGREAETRTEHTKSECISVCASIYSNMYIFICVFVCNTAIIKFVKYIM